MLRLKFPRIEDKLLFFEFASDPNNESGKAVDGVEYFSQRKITKKDKNDAAEYAKQIDSCLLKKINSIKVK